MSNDDRKPKLNDVPPLVAVCVVATTFGLVVALLVDAPFQVKAALALVLATLGLYIKKALS